MKNKYFNQKIQGVYIELNCCVFAQSNCELHIEIISRFIFKFMFQFDDTDAKELISSHLCIHCNDKLCNIYFLFTAR